MTSPFLVFTSPNTILHGFQLGRGQAGGAIRGLAQERCRIVVALLGIADDAVLDAVEGIAGVHDGLVQRLDLGLRERRVVLHQFEGPFHSGGMQMNVRVGGSAHGCGVKILGELRDFDETLPSAGGAAVVIGILRTSAVERGGDQFRLDDGFMHGAIREVGDLLGMAEREHAASARVVGAVAGVIGSGRVAFAQSSRHRGIADGAGPSAISDHLKFSVPVFGGKKDRGVDQRVRRGRQDHQDPAIGRHGKGRLRGSSACGRACRTPATTAATARSWVPIREPG